MKRYTFILWLLLAMMPSAGFTANAAQPSKESNAAVSNSYDKGIKAHKKTVKRNWLKAKAKTAKMEKEQSK